MNPILAIVALAVVGGAVVVVAARDTRTVLLALAVTLVASPAAGRSPGRAPWSGGRLVGAILATYLLWVVARDRGTSTRLAQPDRGLADRLAGRGPGGRRRRRSSASRRTASAPRPAGPPWPARPGSRSRRSPLTPVATGRDVIRVGTGSLLLIDAALLVRAALGGTPGDVEQLVTAAMLVVLAGAVAALAAERAGRRHRRVRVRGSGAGPRASRARRAPARPVLTGQRTE